MARTKQDLALRDAEVKKLKEGLKKERELQRQGLEAASKNDSRLSLAHAEREEAQRATREKEAAERKLKADLEEKEATIERLKNQLAQS